MRNSLHLLIGALLLTPLALSAQTVHNIWELPYKQGIAAQVEDRIITFEELRREIIPLIGRIQQEARTQEEFDQKMAEIYQEVLQNLIDRVIIVKEFAEKEYQLPQTYIENEYDRVLAEDFNNDRAAFLAYLDSQGKNEREYRKELRDRVIVSVMRGQMYKGISEVSPERIENFYNENKIHFFEEESIHLRLILIRSIADETPDLIRQTVNKVMSELDSGRDFADVAQEYSQDSRRANGGDWGWNHRSDLNELIADPAFQLEKGEYSQPIELKGQYYILYVEDRHEEGIQPLSQVRDKIEELLVDQLNHQAQRAWLERIRKKAYIKYY
ncbi:MAG: peptidylprolyl isomerase [Opitutales bacterium]|nr:peptidylprolyl isomerase [Opitutales bacterium]